MKSHYENKLVADLGISLRKITNLAHVENDNSIEDHIKKFDAGWENMYLTATSDLNEDDKEFGEILSSLGECDRAKKEFLLSTFPDIMKYNQMVQNLRAQPKLTYGDIVANLKAYVRQLTWEKKNEYKKESGSKENPVVLAAHQQQNKGGPPKRQIWEPPRHLQNMRLLPKSQKMARYWTYRVRMQNQTTRARRRKSKSRTAKTKRTG